VVTDADIKAKIEGRKAKLGIIGLGYVGLPAAVQFGKSGFEVTGIDIDEVKVSKLNRGVNFIQDVEDEDLKSLVERGKLKATADYDVVDNLDAVIISVPTPFNRNREPDLSAVVEASRGISKRLKRGQLVVLESTTYPGTTDEVVKPILEESGLKAGVDFYLAYAPERLDPGRKDYTVKNTPKLVGGINRESTEMVTFLYQQAIEKVVPVSSAKVAEMAKLLENIFRNVNIALVNEIMLLCDRMKIDIWEVVEAAGTKPFGFMRFYPGPGVGGHCIPVDPVYLSWKAKEYDFFTNFIDLAAEINANIPYYVVEKVISSLISFNGRVKESNILILGAAFKKDVDDVRNSVTLKIIELLNSERVIVSYNDPYIKEIRVKDRVLKSAELTAEGLSGSDCVAILTDHSAYDYQWIVDNSRLVVDTRNATKDVARGREKIVKI
jgi:UDP-N-acetyl-D-glucosamine dehydrogenase